MMYHVMYETETAWGKDVAELMASDSLEECMARVDEDTMDGLVSWVEDDDGDIVY